jgi:hypothetical protein
VNFGPNLAEQDFVRLRLAACGPLMPRGHRANRSCAARDVTTTDQVELLCHGEVTMLLTAVGTTPQFPSHFLTSEVGLVPALARDASGQSRRWADYRIVVLSR